MTNFSENISIFLRSQNMSVRAFEQQIGCSNGVISRCINKGTDISSQLVSKIIEIFPNLNPSWLLLGKGEMLNKSSEIDTSNQNMEIISPVPSDKRSRVNLSPAGLSIKEMKPRIPLDAAAGYLSELTQSISLADCEMQPVIQSFPHYDFTIFAKGDSMAPDIISGDELACRFINEKSFIQWGRIYVLDTTQGVIVKRIFEKGRQIIVRSINSNYPDHKIDKPEVLRMALVVGLIRQL